MHDRAVAEVREGGAEAGVGEGVAVEPVPRRREAEAFSRGHPIGSERIGSVADDDRGSDRVRSDHICIAR